MAEKIEGIMITPKPIKRSEKYKKDVASADKGPESQGQAQEEQENPFIEYNNRTFQSYLKNGHE